MIKDSIYNQKFSGVKLPRLKGKVKITLHNPTTGKNEVVEGENIVTNAVRDIMAANILGGVSYSNFFPLWSNFFGGILCYQNPHEVVSGSISPDNYFCYSQTENPLIAHAGGTVINSDHDDDAKRGNPARISNIYTDNSVKQVWEWTPSHGNGVISSLSLTHKDTGDAGLGSDTYNFRNFSPMLAIGNLSGMDTGRTASDNVFAKYSDDKALCYYIGADGEFRENHVCFETNKLTIYIKKLPYRKAGLFQTQLVETSVSGVSLVKKFTVELSFNLYCQPCFYFDYENKYLWIFTNVNSTSVNGTSGYDRSTVRYSVIDCEAGEEINHGTITSDTANLAPLGLSANTGSPYPGSRAFYENIIKDGNYVYFPTTNGVGNGNGYCYQNVTGLKKINIYSQAEQSFSSFNEAQTRYTSPFRSGDIIINSGRVINGGVGYNCLAFLPLYEGSETSNYNGYAISTPDNPSSYVINIGADDKSNRDRFILANKLVNTTKFNLPSSVTKTTSQSMIIEYSLIQTEESDDE